MVWVYLVARNFPVLSTGGVHVHAHFVYGYELSRIAKKWKRPIKDWAAALNYFTIVFEGRIPA